MCGFGLRPNSKPWSEVPVWRKPTQTDTEFFTQKGSGQNSNWELAAGLQQCREPRTLTAWFSQTRCFCETRALQTQTNT